MHTPLHTPDEPLANLPFEFRGADIMSSAPNTTSTSSSFRTLFDDALAKYTKLTGRDLHSHPLASIIDRCDSPDLIPAIFQEQSRAFDEFRSGGPKLIKLLGYCHVNGDLPKARHSGNATLQNDWL